ncbi:AraC family transcriptional regulator [Paenarthrobacter sp. NPDC089316]|uniref:AraC family transcriptional regulator n=1 Tax=unclassified Paenarthrobacter TaxID=2634190 RepID=UPI00342703A9
MILAQPTSDTLHEVSLEEQHHQWRRALHDRLADLELRPGREFQGHGSAVGRDLGDLLLTDWYCPADLEGVRGSALASRDAESLLLLAVTAGLQVVQTSDDTVVLRPGMLLLMSTRAAAKIIIPDEVRKRTLRVPKTALSPYDTGRGVPDVLCVDTASNPLARLAQDFIHGVDSQLTEMTAADVESVRTALLVLIAGMIRAAHAPDVADTDFLPFLRRAMEDWIAEHLGQGTIRVGDLAAAHNVAPRTVHRAFATTGDTMGSVVRAHRLAAARHDLVHSALNIGAIAHRWGFCDASHLGREFRREFSMSPGDYRAAHGIA